MDNCSNLAVQVADHYLTSELCDSLQSSQKDEISSLFKSLTNKNNSDRQLYSKKKIFKNMQKIIKIFFLNCENIFYFSSSDQRLVHPSCQEGRRRAYKIPCRFTNNRAINSGSHNGNDTPCHVQSQCI